MQKIELNKIKNGSLWRWRYAIIFGVYTFSFLLIFLSVSKFLGKEINRSFGEPVIGTDNVATTLDLASYQRLANRLGISTLTETASPDVSIAASPTTATTSQPSVSSTTTASAIVSPATALVATSAIPQRLSILIANSTKKSGLAGKLKNSLATDIAADFTTATKPPALEQTLIRYKRSVPESDLASVKKDVSKTYSPIVEIDDTGPFDIQIIIGKK